MKVGTMIAKLRRDRQMSQARLGEIVGCTKQTISNYEHDRREPDYETLEAIGDALNVPIEFFLTSEEKRDALAAIYATYRPAGAVPVTRRMIPLLGGIAAGVPSTPAPEFGTYVEADEDAHADYALRVTGDSMEPRIMLGDLVFIRAQDDVDDGDVAAVLLDDETVLKRVYHIPAGLQLISENPKYPPRIVTMPEISTIRIQGKAVALKRLL